MSDRFSLRSIAIPAFAPSLLFGIADGAVLPVVAFSALELGASHAGAGVVAALSGIGSLVSNIPGAALSTRIGERRAMLVAAGFAITGYLLCVLAQHLLLLALGVWLFGMARAVFSLARQTWLIANVPFTMRARALSTLAGSMRIGVFIGPIVGAALIHRYGLHGAYVAALFALAVLVGIVWRLPELPASTADAGAGTAGNVPVATPLPSFAAVWRSHKHIYLSLGIGVFLLSAMRASREVVVPLWSDSMGLTAASASLIYAVAAAVDMTVFYPAGRIMDRYGRIWIALPCTLLMGLGFLLTPLTSGFTSFLCVALLLGLGNGIGSGILMTLGADSAPRDNRARFLGIWRMQADLGSSVGPMLMSAITSAVSLGAGIATIGGLGFVAAAVFWRNLPHRPQRPEPPKATEVPPR